MCWNSLKANCLSKNGQNCSKNEQSQSKNGQNHPYMVKVVTSVGNLIKILKKNFETNILWKKFCDNYFCGTNIFWDQIFLRGNFLGVMVLGTKFLTAIFGTKSILEQHFFQTKYFKTKLRQTVSAWVSPNSTPACLCNLMIRGGVIIKQGLRRTRKLRQCTNWKKIFE